MTTVEEKLKKINDLKQNLIIFNKAYITLKIKSDKAINDSISSLYSEYYYHKFLVSQIEKYKEAQKDPETNDLIDQKNNLKEIYESYKKMRNQDILNNANETILDESNARNFLLNCQSDLIGVLSELVESQDDSIIDEIEMLIKN